MTVMLAAMGITGSMLFAAEPVTKTAPPSPSAAASKDAEATPAQGEAETTASATTAAAKAEGAKAEAAKPEAAAKPAGASAADEEHKASQATAADKAPSPQRFTPSEQVRADFDVSFPVDI